MEETLAPAKVQKMFLPQWYRGFHQEHEVKLHTGAGIVLTRVAQFILNRMDIRRCVPFLMNRDNAI